MAPDNPKETAEVTASASPERVRGARSVGARTEVELLGPMPGR